MGKIPDRPLVRRALLVCAAVVLAGTQAHAQPKPLKARVVSVRGNRVYLQLETERTLTEGQTVVVSRGGKSAKVKLVAASSKFLLIAKPKNLRLEPDQVVTVRAKRGKRATPQVKATPARPIGGSVSIGRRTPTLQQFRAQRPPERKLIGFRTVGGAGDGGEVELVEDEDGEANEARGYLEIGADGAYEDDDDDGNISRTTPYATLRLDVLRLFGSDRASFVFFGTVRQPQHGKRDWTGRNEEHLRARVTAMALVLAPSHPDDIEGFTDRIVLNLGRDNVPDVIEAGVIDGVHVGLQIGPVTPFGFGGYAVSPNPRAEDYDTTTFGGGLRVNYVAAHDGSIRISAAIAQEIYDGEGDRGYVEANLDAQTGIFGVRGSLVYDVFSSVRDDRRERITVAELMGYAQLTDTVRLSAGYSLRRPVYTGALIQEDLSVLANIGGLNLLPESRRINIHGELSYFGKAFELRLRANQYTSREARDSAGGMLTIALLDLFAHDRLYLDIAGQVRHRGDRFPSATQDGSARLGYRFYGDYVTWALDFVYKLTSPKRYGEKRYGARLSLEGTPTTFFALGGYAEYQIQDYAAQDDVDLILVGLYARVMF